jgi:L-histidine Nalpha-methyltransferase
MALNQHAEIIHGLAQPSASIASKYFYDAFGSTLFEAITALPEYYPTRTESLLMQLHGGAIADSIGADPHVIELGAGNCTKAKALCRLLHPRQYVGVDISVDFLQAAIAEMQAEFTQLSIEAVAADISHDFELPHHISRTQRLIFYPGSSIGNFDPTHAVALLSRMRSLVNDDGGVLIGFDLPKATHVLEPAYDDDQGVTARFNRNILAHVNRIIGSDFDLDLWKHCAFFNPHESRIEMHLEAVASATVRWPGGQRQFAARERIHTENSYKYPVERFVGMLAAAGFSQTRIWTDPQQWFAVVHARP